MLERLVIENIALIERLELDLSRGFTVLTGETGAGKSIIIDAVELVLGGRASRELISYGRQKARAEAYFNVGDMPAVLSKLKEIGIVPEDNELFITREITAQGKSTCRVCGEAVQLNTLKQITSLLVDVHGQHEHQSLLDEQNHLSVLDAYHASEIEPLKAVTARIYSEYAEVNALLKAGFMSEAERERRIDILKYQINEIRAANLKPDEEKTISDELRLLTNAEKVVGGLSACSAALSDGSGLDSIKKASDALNTAAEYAPQFAETAARLSDLYYELEDVSYTVRGMRVDTDFDPRRIDSLEMRLDVIDALKHKYGRTIEEVLSFAFDAEAELERLTGSAEEREQLLKRRGEIKARYGKAAAELTSARKKAADELCRKAEAELAALGMKKARLGAEFGTIDDEPHPDGSDTAAFLLSANEGEPLKALSKVASGGELSRIMLALKTVITDADGIPTLIFDEVDTGISGSTANVVGLRMKRIAKAHQVLCVTHLPQIAAFADEHFLVEKSAFEGRTYTHLKKLDRDARIAELARIMGAEAGSSAALTHAGELIEKAQKADI